MSEPNPFAAIGKFVNEMNEFSIRISKIIEETIPKITLPEITFPEIDFERIRKNTNHNAKFGWTLTGGMGLGEYLNDDLLKMSKRQLDDYFFNYYVENDWKFFRETKNEILETIEPNRKELAKECFDCFENEQHKTTIPTLITIIEGEIASILQTKDYGWRLYEQMKSSDDDEDKFRQIATYSVYNYLKKELFVPHDFSKNRRMNINRNWVLHGRDNPNKWTKYDALRLINVLASLQFIKEYMKE